MYRCRYNTTNQFISISMFYFLSLPLAIPFGAKLDDGNKAPPHDVPTAQYLHKFIMIRPNEMQGTLHTLKIKGLLSF